MSVAERKEKHRKLGIKVTETPTNTDNGWSPSVPEGGGKDGKRTPSVTSNGTKSSR